MLYDARSDLPYVGLAVVYSDARSLAASLQLHLLMTCGRLRNHTQPATMHIQLWRSTLLIFDSLIILSIVVERHPFFPCQSTDKLNHIIRKAHATLGFP